MRSTSPSRAPSLSTVPFEHGLYIEDVAARAARGAQYPAVAPNHKVEQSGSVQTSIIPVFAVVSIVLAIGISASLYGVMWVMTNG